MTPTHIMLHHSLTKDSGSVSWDAIRRYHTGWKYKGTIVSAETAQSLIAQGETVQAPWSDVGYHFGVELIGDHVEVLLGREFDQQGAHCPQGGMNRKALAICVVGDYDHYLPPANIWQSALDLTRQLMLLHKIPVENVTCHREHYPAKTCPGVLWSMEKFRKELAA